MSAVYCPQCNIELKNDAKFCGICGTRAVNDGFLPEDVVATGLLTTLRLNSTPDPGRTPAPPPQPIPDSSEIEPGLDEMLDNLMPAQPPQLIDEPDVSLEDEVIELTPDDYETLADDEVSDDDAYLMVFGPEGTNK